VIAYCIGAGEDITFDGALASSGCTVRCCDPTPRAVLHIEAFAPATPLFRFAPFALWKADCELRFFEPKDSAHVSYSAVNIQHTDNHIVVAGRTLASMMSYFGDSRLDILKLDIEGAEMEVLPVLLDSSILPSILCVEFDRPAPIIELLSLWKALWRSGYRPVRSDRLSVLLLRPAGRA
jgi:FkbM family methyltransferase